MYPSDVIRSPQQRLTLTYGHSSWAVTVPLRCSTTMWKRLPWLSPTRMSPESLTSMPFGYAVSDSSPRRRTNLPSSVNTVTQCPWNETTHILAINTSDRYNIVICNLDHQQQYCNNSLQRCRFIAIWTTSLSVWLWNIWHPRTTWQQTLPHNIQQMTGYGWTKSWFNQSATWQWHIILEVR